MKILKLAITLLITANLSAQVNFDDFFITKTLRIDYTRAGNSEKTYVYFEKYMQEQFWGGSQKNLVDTFNYGDYRVLVYDSLGEKLLYSRGFSSLFREWIETQEAKTISRSYYESITIPFPKNTIQVKIQDRDFNNKFNTVFELTVNPLNYQIEKSNSSKYTTEKLHYSGDASKKLDIVILAEGYTKDELEKFKKDANRFVGYFFEVSPFKENKDKVNFWAVNSYSAETGTDIPGDNIWKNTVLNTHFYTFDSERYLTTSDVKQIRDLASYVPYDQIYILVNSAKYGGGGIYNYYNLCTSDHPVSGKVFTHEFGHAFVALADEYQYGYENAENHYNLNIEPWQVNITSLANFDSKWKNLVNDRTQIPTPDIDENKSKVGAFEGAGYVKTKIYRPTHDCKMRSNNTDEFCPVCKKAVLDMLLFYCE